MRNPIRAWLAAFGVLIVFAVAAFALPPMIGLVAKRALVFRLAFVLLGVIAGMLTLVLLLRRPTTTRVSPPDAAVDDIDLGFAGAEARLRTSRAAPESRISRLPVVLVLGPQGATKSSIVTHSGIDAELLHGEVFRGDSILPTDPVNVWYAQGMVVVEAGGRLLDDAGRWTRLISHLRAGRLAAAVGRGRQAARVAVVCFACDELLKHGASESVAGVARRLRGRLSELSQQLGIRLPVYVVFTRADRLTGFTDYVRNFTTEDAQQVLGATLPLMVEGDAGWAESQAARLHDAFGRLVHSLGTARLDVLDRENQESARGAAYEFPREFSKITELAVQFLVDVCRPSQLGVNPFLRGFYFVGVRPVIVRDAAVDAPTPRMAASPASDATSVFSAGVPFASGAAPAASAVGGRKVPQWTFLRRLFPEVIFADSTALTLTGGGTRVDLLRRGLISAAAAALFVVSLGMTYSFAGNRSLVRRSLAAATKAHTVSGVAAITTAGDLQRLDSLRALTQQMLDYKRNGHGVGLSWGLYVGDTVAPVLRRVYFDSFERVLWKGTRDSLVAYLSALPPTPTESSDFGRTQDALAGYLLTTSEYARARPDLLEPALMSYVRDPGKDSTRAVVERQFTFFASELPFGNPYQTTVNTALVQRTQNFLREFGSAAYYRALLSEADRVVPSVRYVDPSGVVRNDVVVPGAFTPAGRAIVEAELDSVDRVFSRYQWIYGDYPPKEKPQRDELQREYIADYVASWQRFINEAKVVRFASAPEAAAKLQQLGDPASSLFQMLASASRNTNADSTMPLAKAFQPLHAVVPPAADARGAGSSALLYTNALAALGSQMNLGAGAQAGTALQAITSVRTAAGTLAGSAMSSEAAATAAALRKLLLQPADLAEQLLRAMPAADLNRAGQSFCGTYTAVTQKFPFNRASKSDASVEEVNSVFSKEGGQLWGFYKARLDTLLTERGDGKAGVRVNRAFAQFFKAAAAVTSGLYSDGQPRADFRFRAQLPPGATEVIFDLNGDQARFSPTSSVFRPFKWEAKPAGRAELTVVYPDGQKVVVASGAGVWAPFRLMQSATWNGDRLEWRVPGRNAAVTAEVSSSPPGVFNTGYLSAASSCVSQIVN